MPFEFRPIDLAPILGDELAGTTVGVQFSGDEEPYLFTEWSRGQLLSHLGVKEKWFFSVSKEQEADELNYRRPRFANYRFRKMLSAGSEPIRFMRGLVSKHYAEISDTTIMRALTTLLPSGLAIAHSSEKTDRAFYAYVLDDKEIGIPGTNFRGFPGVVVKNSEVGYTALWVSPTLYVPHYHRGRGKTLILEQRKVLYRVHRGDVESITSDFSEALEKAAAVWGETETRSKALVSLVFRSEDDAIARMSGLILAAKGAQSLVRQCEVSYRACGHLTHTGLTVMETIVENATIDNADDEYTDSALAGAVLWGLTA